MPLDGSRLAEQVLSHAVVFAKMVKAEVVLMHVVPTSGRMPHPPTPSQAAATEDIGAYLKKVAERLRKAEKAEIGWRVTCGDPIGDLVRYITEGDIDLVAMCTHGKGGQTEEDLGSVAQELSQKVSVPVLPLKPEGEIAGI